MIHDKFWKTFKNNQVFARRNKPLLPFNTILYSEKVNRDFEQLLLSMSCTLPYTETEIKRRPYTEFFALMNRTEEIIQSKNDSK